MSLAAFLAAGFAFEARACGEGARRAGDRWRLVAGIGGHWWARWRRGFRRDSRTLFSTCMLGLGRCIRRAFGFCLTTSRGADEPTSRRHRRGRGRGGHGGLLRRACGDAAFECAASMRRWSSILRRTAIDRMPRDARGAPRQASRRARAGAPAARGSRLARAERRAGGRGQKFSCNACRFRRNPFVVTIERARASGALDR